MSTDLLGLGTNAANVVTVRPTENRIFGPADTWGKDCSSPTAGDGTRVPAAFVNGLLAQFRSAIRQAGVTEDNTDDQMLWKAIQSGSLVHFGVDTGVADALVVAVLPAVSAFVAGLYYVKAAATNATATPTIVLNGLAAKPIVHVDGSAFAPGEIVAGGWLGLLWDSSRGKFVLVETTKAYVDARTSGRLLRAPRILLSGTSYTTPAGCNSIYVEAQGGGGGGNINTYGGCGGGGGGMAAKHFAVTPSTAYACTIGAGGSAGAGGGAAGGDTTFTVAGVTITGGGGLAGGGGGQGSALTWAGGGGNGGLATGGDVNIHGSAGAFTHADITETILGGSAFFSGARWASSAGQGYGAGGQGGTSAVTGTSGGQGLIRIWEYS